MPSDRLAARTISSRDCDGGLPCSRVSSSARLSCCTRSAALRRSIHKRRCSKELSRQLWNARGARDQLAVDELGEIGTQRENVCSASSGHASACSHCLPVGRPLT